ncbi:hypothetical protein F3Y22_tig00110391pilonHSYRG00180 [Hibiscus syriacus]|uniref:Uncharacterized protein n=1 Tax=Hibiscus syriacus TaxID=106335 RepID=A0A6A3AUU8_HIBSY|nr:hypothetical protein F3Y22_tig00110391pilonHSYRG00180 [Hibiscus syriacus]
MIITKYYTNLKVFIRFTKSPFNQIASLQALVIAMYYVYVVDKAIILLRVAFQLMAHPPTVKTYPVSDLLLSRSLVKSESRYPTTPSLVCPNNRTKIFRLKLLVKLANASIEWELLMICDIGFPSMIYLIATVLHSDNAQQCQCYIQIIYPMFEEVVKKFFSYLEPLIVEAKNNNLTRMALEDCKNMMNYSVDSLWASYSDIREGDMLSIDDRINNPRTGLNVVISYQQSCLNGFEHDRGMKEKVEKSIVDAREFTCNALTIVTNLLDILSKFNIKLRNPNGRELLSVEKNAGIYDEHITVEKQYINILMYGDGPRKTIITGHKGVKDGSGITTWRTATFAAVGNGFIAKSMGFQNTADTLYDQANRQFFGNCIISGTIDFIFSDSATIIQNSLIIVKRAMQNQFNTVTAQGKDFVDENTGFVIQNCRIIPEKKLFEGSGPGADLNARVKWKDYHIMDKATAMDFTIRSFRLSKENWLPLTGIPFTSRLRH